MEHHTHLNDYFLPDIEELRELKEVDPEIMIWIKERTAKEQDARIRHNDNRLNIANDAIKKNHTVDVITLMSALVINLAGMALSALLLFQGQNVAGSLFGGLTIVFAANAFLNFRKTGRAREKN